MRHPQPTQDEDAHAGIIGKVRFAGLAEGGTISAEDVYERARESRYLSADEALRYQLVAACCNRATWRNQPSRSNFYGDNEETMMAVSQTGVVERIARVLAGRRASQNAGGTKESAGPDVDQNWREHREDALSILRTLREPDQAMAAAGDAAIWEKMVRAALDEAGGSSAGPI